MSYIYPNLVHEMANQNVSITAIARLLGITEAKVIRKLRGKIEWGLIEALMVAKHLHCKDLEMLFLIKIH